MKLRIGAAVAGIMVISGLSLGCAEDPQEEYREATRTVSEAQKAVERAEKQVVEQKTDLLDAETALNEAREALTRSRDALVEAESKIDVEVSDSFLFRAVQKRLLEDRTLQDVAISARVERSVVVLSGRVATRAQRDRAVKIAQQVPGVTRVEDKISIEAPGPVAAPSR